MSAAQIRDPDLPAVALLLGGDPDALVADRLGGEHVPPRGLRRSQVLYRPGRSISVVFRPRRDNHGDARRPGLVAAVGDRDGLAVWRFPDDPRLPGLARAAAEAGARDLSERAGVPAAAVAVDVRAYRPGRRAVLAVGPAGARSASLFLKVVRPGRAHRVARRHAALAGSVPVPACRLCLDELGVVALEALPGETLRARLREPAAPLPAPGELAELLDRLARTPLAAGRVAGATERARRHVPLLTALLPRHARRVERLARALGEDRPAPLVTAHGDLYESQLLVGGDGRVVGLLDVDGAGPGERADDAASLVGRLWTAARAAPREDRARRSRYAEDVFEAFARDCDPRELARRVAAIVLGRATGPFRAQQRDWRARAVVRIELAERWLAAAPSGEPPR